MSFHLDNAYPCQIFYFFDMLPVFKILSIINLIYYIIQIQMIPNPKHPYGYPFAQPNYSNFGPLLQQQPNYYNSAINSNSPRQPPHQISVPSPNVMPQQQVAQEDNQEIPYQKTNAFTMAIFYNQYRLIKTPRHLMILFAILAAIFVALTGFSLLMSFRAKQLEMDYAEENRCTALNQTSPKCSIHFQIKQTMAAPVYFLYSVKNIYVNHRNYLNSQNVEQLKGKAISLETAEKSCGKFVFNNQIYNKTSWNNVPLVPKDIASPCGLKSQGYFNDTFSLYRNGAKIQIDESKIYNRTALKINRGPSSEVVQWIDPENKHFKQYLIDGSLMTKKKLWGIITNDLEAGKYEMIANNNYMMADMKIKKGIILATTTLMGGRQFFYPVVFSICALLCFVYILVVWNQFRSYTQIRTEYKQYDQKKK